MAEKAKIKRKNFPDYEASVWEMDDEAFMEEMKKRAKVIKNSGLKVNIAGASGVAVSGLLLLTTSLLTGGILTGFWITAGILGGTAVTSVVSSFIAGRRFRKYSKVMRDIDRLVALKKIKNCPMEQVIALERKVDKGLTYLHNKRMISEREMLVRARGLLDASIDYSQPVYEIKKQKIAQEDEKINQALKGFGATMEDSVKNTANGVMANMGVTHGKEFKAEILVETPTRVDGSTRRNKDKEVLFDNQEVVHVNNELELALAQSSVLATLGSEFKKENSYVKFPIRVTIGSDIVAIENEQDLEDALSHYNTLSKSILENLPKTEKDKGEEKEETGKPKSLGSPTADEDKDKNKGKEEAGKSEGEDTGKPKEEGYEMC